jgi:hypothetical protein
MVSKYGYRLETMPSRATGQQAYEAGSLPKESTRPGRRNRPSAPKPKRLATGRNTTISKPNSSTATHKDPPASCPPACVPPRTTTGWTASSGGSLLPEAVKNGALIPVMALLNFSFLVIVVALWGLVYLGQQGLWWRVVMVVVGGIILALISYRAAVVQAQDYGERVRSAIDLYRFDLLKAFSSVKEGDVLSLPRP